MIIIQPDITRALANIVVTRKYGCFSWSHTSFREVGQPWKKPGIVHKISYMNESWQFTWTTWQCTNLNRWHSFNCLYLGENKILQIVFFVFWINEQHVNQVSLNTIICMVCNFLVRHKESFVYSSIKLK